MSRRSVGAVVAATCILVFVYLVSAPDAAGDIRADRLTALAALDGIDPYVPVRELAQRYGSPLWWTWIHPRTPGAIVLQTPLVLLSENLFRGISVAMTAFGVAATAIVGMRLRPSRTGLLVVAAVCAGAVTIAVEAVTVGAQSSVVALLLAFAWWRTRSSDDALSGVAVGVAVTLKVFPWLLIVLLAWKRKRAAVAAVTTGVALNVGGLLFPGVDLGRAIDALSSANVSASLDLNASLSRLVGGGDGFVVLGAVLAVCALVGTVFVAHRGWEWDQAWFAVLGLSLAASPLIWSHYALVLIPAVIWMIMRGSTTVRALGVLAVVLLFVPHPHFTAWVAVPYLVVAVVVSALLTSELTRQSMMESPEPSRTLDS